LPEGVHVAYPREDQQLSRLRWADRLQRREGVSSGEQLGGLEDPPDVVVAGDDPVVEVGTVEDAGGRPCLRKEGARIGKVRIMKWIETLAPVNARIPVSARRAAEKSG
jgi:hypothetical protein